MTFKIISIEGNIGAGKTTFMNKLEKSNTDSSIVFVREPVDIWEKYKNRHGETLIKKYYENPQQYSFVFQFVALTTRLKLLKETIEKNKQAKLFICERSLETDKEIFAKMLHDDGFIDDIMYRVYGEHFNDNVINELKSSGIIYINTPTVTSFNRILQRNRTGEEKITLSYLHRCDIFHNLWFNKCKIPILKINSEFNQGKEFMIHRFFQRILLWNMDNETDGEPEQCKEEKLDVIEVN